MRTSGKQKVLIVGGGAGGITVAARLRHAAPALEITIIEPSEVHYYQPLFTLIGGGVSTLAEASRATAELVPSGVTWVKDSVATFNPTHNELNTVGGKTMAYDYLVVAPGLECHWDGVEGLTAALGKKGVCSNYSSKHVLDTWRFFQEFKGGTAIFTFPNTPIKCGGAPQKIMYLFEHYLRLHGLRDKSKVMFASANPGIFGVPKYAAVLSQIIKDRGIETRFQHNLVKVDGERQVATFQKVGTEERVEIPYNFLHVTPPMRSPRFVANSPLADAAGWVEVDKATTRHVRFPNVFSLGDASSLPTGKTGAAIRKQAPVLVSHLLAAMQGQSSTAKYDGYTSCPLVTGYGRLVLAEFDYDSKPVETFPFDQGKERRSMYWLKKYLLPQMYWHGMLKGRV